MKNDKKEEEQILVIKIPNVESYVIFEFENKGTIACSISTLWEKCITASSS